jgi:hypothetical protein
MEVWMAIGLVLLFSTAYAGHLALGRAPKCHCLAAIEAFTASIHDAKIVLTRNLAMIGVLLWSSLAGRRYP